MASREQVLKEAAEKREYLKSLVAEQPGASAALLLGKVHAKFGSGVSPRTLHSLREEMRKEAKGVKVAPTPAALDDERLEVQLIAQLQGLMTRQGYQTIIIPVEGAANIRMLVVKEKVPGEHVESAMMH